MPYFFLQIIAAFLKKIMSTPAKDDDLLFYASIPEELDNSLETLSNALSSTPDEFKELVGSLVNRVYRVQCRGRIGTAFHYGNGWVASNAHVLPLQDLSSASLTSIGENNDGKDFSLSNCKAYSFLVSHSLQSRTPDLVLVYVQQILDLNPTPKGLASLPSESISLEMIIGATEPLADNLEAGTLFVLHFGSGDPKHPLQCSKGQITQKKRFLFQMKVLFR